MCLISDDNYSPEIGIIVKLLKGYQKMNANSSKQ